jgi:hypothetical protein
VEHFDRGTQETDTMTKREVKAYEAKARRMACALARDFEMPVDATTEQSIAVLEAMRDEISVGIRILATLDAAVSA